MSITEKAAEFLVNFRYEDIPPEVIRQTKRCILDALGCAIGAYHTGLGKTVIASIKEFAGPPQSTIIGDGSKLAPHQAAFANASLANMLDFDDTSEGIGHPGSMVIPSALAVAEAEKLTGMDFLLAVVLAYEMSTRIGYSIKPSPPRARAIFPSPCWGIYSGVTAASKLLSLDKGQTLAAFGLAGDGAPVPQSTSKNGERPLGWNKGGISFASSNGVLAAYMARNGVPGCQTIFDGGGLWVKAGSDTCDSNLILSGLGEEYKIMAISFKPYPSVAWFHSANDAAAAIVKKQGIKPEDVKGIRVAVGALAARHPDYIPKTMTDCEFSLHYGVAMVVLGVPPGLGWFTEEMMNSQVVVDLLKKIKVEADPEATRLFDSSKGAIQRATVTITTRGGQVLTECVEEKRGSVTQPLTDQELESKFLDLAIPVLKDRSAQVVQTVYCLEEIKDISALTRIMH